MYIHARVFSSLLNSLPILLCLPFAKLNQDRMPRGGTLEMFIDANIAEIAQIASDLAQEAEHQMHDNHSDVPVMNLLFASNLAAIYKSR